MTQHDLYEQEVRETLNGNPNPILWEMTEKGLQEKRHGMNNNLDINKGVAFEAEKFEKYKVLIMQCLEADNIELLNGTLMDFHGGIDALYTVRGKKGVYGLSLRFRNKYYNSFTLNRHYKDINSEINKWSNKNSLRANIHIQISDLGDDRVNVTVVDVHAFGRYLEAVRDNFPMQLEQRYNHKLDAYEFEEKFTRYRRDVVNFSRNVEIL